MPAVAAVPVGWVVIRSQDPPRRLEARVVDRANVTDGFGGWEEVTRPKRTPLTVWRSRPPLHMDLPLLFDGLAVNRSVERDVADLQRLAAPFASDRRPSRIRLNARGTFIPFLDRTWVISSLGFGDGAMNRNGVRVRQEVTLSLLEFVEDVRLAEQSAANRARFKAAAAKLQEGAASKRVVAGRDTTAPTNAGGRAAEPVPAPVFAPTEFAAVKQPAAHVGAGYDLLRIAATELGDANRWTEIADLNGIRDPRSIVPGQVIRLP